MTTGIRPEPLGQNSGASIAQLTASLPPNPYFGGMKRFSDLVLVALVAPIAVPLVLLLWVLVRLDGGPGFFTQPRVGLDGRIFRCWKLRSMAIDAEARLQRMCDTDPEIAREWQENQKLADDPRITAIGRLLRKTSLDELPQLWNILTGEMSVVGPRPFMPEQQDLYVEAGGRAYFRMRPGVTGPWQVFGRSKTRFTDRVMFDEGYFEQASLLTDTRLLLHTGLVVIRMTGR